MSEDRLVLHAEGGGPGRVTVVCPRGWALAFHSRGAKVSDLQVCVCVCVCVCECVCK